MSSESFDMKKIKGQRKSTKTKRKEIAEKIFSKLSLALKEYAVPLHERKKARKGGQ